ncbi:MAG: CUAEP/CCAEP-tail radical SAM protein [Chloroflexi bacterium]|nr:CUAEP/CCAEP-tail radical SAM protein [Chloroflexota bacterium]
MHVVLISTYELGRQPFGLASPAAWLGQAGAEVTCLDLAVQGLDEQAIRAADLVAFYLPMHTATRLVVPLIERVTRLNGGAHLACYGLYAPMNEIYLRGLGVNTILGGEYESGLTALVKRLSANGSAPHAADQREPTVSLARQLFITPQRSGLPPLSQYAQLNMGDNQSRIVGYTEASRGCKHKCRHCPVVPVYEGMFRVVQRDVVLEDIRQQVRAGAEHITFGDPDFFNGIGHALPLVRSLHTEFPQLTYDVTIKIEHLLRHAEHLPTLRDTGCLFVTSALESINERVLSRLDKGHTQEDIIQVVNWFQEVGLTLNPTLVSFTPWTTLDGYRQLLAFLDQYDLVENMASIHLAIRLLIPAGSKLLELTEVQALVGPFDEQLLIYPWQNSEPSVDHLHQDVLALVETGVARGEERREIFAQVAALVGLPVREANGRQPRAPIPYLTEPWYCCAEPTEEQFAPL